jgi:hypothetical protein
MGCRSCKSDPCCCQAYRGPQGPSGLRGPRGATGPAGPGAAGDWFSNPIYTDAQVYKVRTSLSYVAVARIQFPGTANVVGTPSAVRANVWSVAPGAVCACRIYDVTNSLVIAENTNITSTSNLNIETLTITPANISATPAVWEVQILGVNGGTPAETAIAAVSIRST